MSATGSRWTAPTPHRSPAPSWPDSQTPESASVPAVGEPVAACDALAARLLKHGVLSYSERAVAGVPVTASRIAVGTVHQDQAMLARYACPGLCPEPVASYLVAGLGRLEPVASYLVAGLGRSAR